MNKELDDPVAAGRAVTRLHEIWPLAHMDVSARERAVKLEYDRARQATR